MAASSEGRARASVSRVRLNRANTVKVFLPFRRRFVEAAEAMVGFAVVDVNDVKTIRELQNKILRFDDLVRWTREIISAGYHAEELSKEDLDNVRADLIERGEFEEAEQLGLIERELKDA